MPDLARLAARGEVGRAAVIPPRMAPGSDVGNMSILGYDPARYHTGRAPIEAAALGLQAAPRPGRLPLQPGRRWAATAPWSTSPADTRPPRTRPRSSAPSTTPWGEAPAARSSSTPGSSTATSSWPPRAGPTPRAPRRTTSPAGRRCCPAGRPRPSSSTLMDASRAIVGPSPLAATQVWLWGQGHQPQLPVVRGGAPVARGALVTAVDLIRGLGVLTGMDVVEVPGATGWFDTDYEGKRDAALRTPRRRGRRVPPPRRGHRRGRARRRPRREGQGPRGVGQPHPRPGWSTGSTPWARGGCCCCPTTPRPSSCAPTRPTRCRTCWSTARSTARAARTPRRRRAAAVRRLPGHEMLGRLLAR